MTKVKKYKDSLLSVLCIVSWFVIVVRIFKTATDESAITAFVMTVMITITVGVVGGILLILADILKKGKLRFSFFYNLLGTLDILIGCFGMMLPQREGRPTPYIISASLCVGLVMYSAIYSRNKVPFLR